MMEINWFYVSIFLYLSGLMFTSSQFLACFDREFHSIPKTIIKAIVWPLLIAYAPLKSLLTKLDIQ